VVDQKAIQVNDEQYWLYAAVNPRTNRALHLRLFPTYTILIVREFHIELADKHDVEGDLFLVNDVDGPIGGFCRETYSYRVEQRGFRNSFKYILREIKRRLSFLRVFYLRRSTDRRNVITNPRRLVE
jgi:putative transposase